MSTSRYPRVMIELRPTPMLPGEIGVFAVRTIAMGKVIAPASVFRLDVWMSWKASSRLDKCTRQKLFQYCPGERNGFHAPDDMNYLPLPWFTNHSCCPNAAFDAQGNLIARQVIRSGTEILWDYSTLEHNPLFRMVCKCGSRNCRKVIRAAGL